MPRQSVPLWNGFILSHWLWRCALFHQRLWLAPVGHVALAHHITPHHGGPPPAPKTKTGKNGHGGWPTIKLIYVSGQICVAILGLIWQSQRFVIVMGDVSLAQISAQLPGIWDLGLWLGVGGWVVGIGVVGVGGVCCAKWFQRLSFVWSRQKVYDLLMSN